MQLIIIASPGAVVQWKLIPHGLAQELSEQYILQFSLLCVRFPPLNQSLVSRGAVSCLPQREKLDFARWMFALCCIHRIKINSGAARKKKKKSPLRLGAQRHNGLKSKALLTPGKKATSKAAHFPIITQYK